MILLLINLETLIQYFSTDKKFNADPDKRVANSKIITHATISFYFDSMKERQTLRPI